MILLINSPCRLRAGTIITALLMALAACSDAPTSAELKCTADYLNTVIPGFEKVVGVVSRRDQSAQPDLQREMLALLDLQANFDISKCPRDLEEAVENILSTGQPILAHRDEISAGRPVSIPGNPWTRNFEAQTNAFKMYDAYMHRPGVAEFLDPWYQAFLRNKRPSRPN